MPGLIGIYFGSVTGGGRDGTRASEGTEATPIATKALNTTLNEETGPVLLAIRTNLGYIAQGGVTITPVGNGYDAWQLAPAIISDGIASPGTFGEWGAGLSISADVDDINTLFYYNARAVSSELPLNDTSVDLDIAATISQK